MSKLEYDPSITEFRKWVKQLSIMELILIQYDLRKYEEDKQFLNIVLEEIKRREIRGEVERGKISKTSKGKEELNHD